MLSPVDSKRQWRRFLVYDLEWVPGIGPGKDGQRFAQLLKENNLEPMQLRMAGVFDGVRYRWYRTIESFLACELNRENRGRWFYAHAGGLADIQFFFERFVRDKYQVKASFSGSSAIIVHVGKGASTRNEGRNGDSLGHDVYHFVDSYWLLRDSLRNIGKSIGLEKGGPELEQNGTSEAETKEWYATVSLPELVSYNEQDCVILWKAIQQFQWKLWEFGGQLQMTLASSAMQLFRRQYLSDRIVTRESINEAARLAYVASRVEVFEKECRNAYYYDVNSSFPYSMTKPLPGNCIGGGYGRLPKAKHYLAKCEVQVPDMQIPPIPLRAGGRIFFPTGRWTAWFNNIDIDFLEESGGSILRVEDTHSFEPFTDLADYAWDLYERRKNSKDEFEKYCYKLLLNSLYGKFAESDLKAGVFINPSAAIMSTFDEELTQRLMPGVFLHPEIVPVPHMHVPISCHITANSRRLLSQLFNMTTSLHYGDTDGFSTGDYFPTGKELGNLKLEKYWRHARYEAPKLYQGEGYENKGGQWQPITLTKAKGFSLGKDVKKAEALFLQLVNAGEIHVTRMERIRSLLRGASEHGLNPRETEIAKRLKKNAMGKRFMYPDGKTRPWSVEEIRSAYPNEHDV